MVFANRFIVYNDQYEKMSKVKIFELDKVWEKQKIKITKSVICTNLNTRFSFFADTFSVNRDL